MTKTSGTVKYLKLMNNAISDDLRITANEDLSFRHSRISWREVKVQFVGQEVKSHRNVIVTINDV